MKTLCDKLAVSELPLFATIEAKSRCRTCFGKVDEHGYLKAPITAAEPDASPARRSAEIISMPMTKKKPGQRKDDKG